MTLEALKNELPDWAKDVRLNLSALPDTPNLTPAQLYGTMLAAAAASRNPRVYRAVRAEAAARLSPEAVKAALAAASLMAMNNIYFRFAHQVGDPEYGTMPARLRMNFIGAPGIPKEDFELICLAVSAMNGCGYCVAGHEKLVREKGLPRESVQNAVRVAAVIQSAAVALEAAAAEAAGATAP